MTLGIFHDILTLQSRTFNQNKSQFSLQIILANLNSKLFWCGIMTKLNETLGYEEQTLTFLHTVLPTREQVVEFSKCPTTPGMNEGIR